MDYIINELEKEVNINRFNDNNTNVALYNKIKLDYLLILTIACAWDMRKSNSHIGKDFFKKSAQVFKRPLTGELIGLMQRLDIDSEIINVFDQYKDDRNQHFGHCILNDHMINIFMNDGIKNLSQLSQLPLENENAILQKLYIQDNDLYYIKGIKNNEMLVFQFTKSGYQPLKFPMNEMKARLYNKNNSLKERDLYMRIDDFFIKVSPFLTYEEKEKDFALLQMIDVSPTLSFKMSLFLTPYRQNDEEDEDEVFIRKEPFPEEFLPYFNNEEKDKMSSINGITINRFSQYNIFEKEKYYDIHLSVLDKLDQFVVSHSAYGSIRGVGGVGKTSCVYMWLRRLKDNNHILANIRKTFNLRNIIFLSAKTKMYVRTIEDSQNLTNFYDINSDVQSYEDIIDAIYNFFVSINDRKKDFNDREKFVIKKASKSNKNASTTLIIIDDYESLSVEDRNKIQQLKNYLDPRCMKLLITTRFSVKESIDIIVEQLDERSCEELTTCIFETSDWKQKISPKEMHELTGGIPLLIWYAKSSYNIGMLSTQHLKGPFDRPNRGISSYLYDNFLSGFEEEFSQNFIMLATRFYKLHHILQISKRNAIFLCLPEPQEYKPEDEEHYFDELLSLKIISINSISGMIDYSPLLTYIEKYNKEHFIEKQYMKDNMELIVNLDEVQYDENDSLLNAIEHLELKTKESVLNRLVLFANYDLELKSIALERVFYLTNNKIQLYKDNQTLFQNNSILITRFLNYLLNDFSGHYNIEHYKLIKQFIFSIYNHLDKQDNTIRHQCIKIIINEFNWLYNAKLNMRIKNNELYEEVKALGPLAADFATSLSDVLSCEEYEDMKSKMNDVLDNIGIYTDEANKYLLTS